MCLANRCRSWEPVTNDIGGNLLFLHIVGNSLKGPEVPQGYFVNPDGHI